jgi:hypothetical protein
MLFSFSIRGGPGNFLVLARRTHQKLCVQMRSWRNKSTLERVSSLSFSFKSKELDRHKSIKEA